MPEKTDISQQIKKYLDGKLSPRAMHELERRAQDDPFLMDALEGYQNSPVNIDAGISELTNRLQKRTEKKEARIIPWRTISIAASILILLGLGLFWLTGQKPSQIQKTVALAPPVQKPVVQPGSTDSVITPEHADELTKPALADKNRLAINRKKHKYSILQAQGNAEVDVAAVQPVVGVSNNEPVAANTDKTKNTPPLNEMVVMEYTAKKNANVVSQYKSTDTTLLSSARGYSANAKPDTSSFKVTRIKGTDVAKLDDRQSGSNGNALISAMPKANMLAEQAQLSQIHNDITPIAARPLASSMRGYLAKRPTAGGMAPLNPVIVHGKMVNGMVKESGEPVEYATVKIKGTTISTLTDSKGKFTLYAVPDSAIIQVLGNGSVLKEAKVTRRNMQLIELNLVMNTLDNGAAIAPNDNGVIDYSRPRPSTGWDDLDTYLRQNAVSSDGKTGIVKVSFTVNTDNSLSDFKIVQSLGTQTDNAAIKLIKDGPAWYSSSDDSAQTITVSVKFHARSK